MSEEPIDPFVDGSEDAFEGGESESSLLERAEKIGGLSSAQLSPEEIVNSNRPEPERKVPGVSYSQWAIGGNGRYSPVGETIVRIPPGVYQPYAMPGEKGFQRIPISSDGIYNLPDMATQEVLAEVETFWNNEPRYRQHNLLHKRGVMLYGPPGSGKTVTVKMLTNELVNRGGIVIISPSPAVTAMMLKDLRAIEPKRPIIVVLEDVDEIINYSGEAIVLSLLDGEHNVDNVLNIATTNYPDRLGARIMNRPSRFDRRVYVGMPGDAARKAYLDNATNKGLSDAELAKWTTDTENMSIAHLREMVAAVYCLGQSYEDVLKRLKEMAQPIKVKKDGFADRSMGFTSKESY